MGKRITILLTFLLLLSASAGTVSAHGWGGRGNGRRAGFFRLNGDDRCGVRQERVLFVNRRARVSPFFLADRDNFGFRRSSLARHENFERLSLIRHQQAERRLALSQGFFARRSLAEHQRQERLALLRHQQGERFTIRRW